MYKFCLFAILSVSIVGQSIAATEDNYQEVIVESTPAGAEVRVFRSDAVLTKIEFADNEVEGDRPEKRPKKFYQLGLHLLQGKVREVLSKRY